MSVVHCFVIFVQWTVLLVNCQHNKEQIPPVSRWCCWCLASALPPAINHSNVQFFDCPRWCPRMFHAPMSERISWCITLLLYRTVLQECGWCNCKKMTRSRLPSLHCFNSCHPLGSERTGSICKVQHYFFCQFHGKKILHTGDTNSLDRCG